jgi:hypothetical protein
MKTLTGPRMLRQVLPLAPAGSIIIAHTNHPEGGAAKGIAGSVPQMKANGYCWSASPT